MKNAAIDNACNDISEVFMFDQWLRFYFIFEEDKKLSVKIPDEALAQIEKDQPNFKKLADMYNNEEVDQQKSMDNVCSFVGANYDGTKYSSKIIPKVFDSKNFKLEMYVFNLWMKGHETYLESEVMTFAEWKELYAGWKEQEEVISYLKRLQNAGAGSHITPPTCTTIQ